MRRREDNLKAALESRALAAHGAAPPKAISSRGINPAPQGFGFLHRYSALSRK